MTMLRWISAQRAVLTDKLPDFANVAVAALVFGQAFSDAAFSAWLALLGVAIWLAFMTLAVLVAAKEREP
jgi:hypothetical protein